MTRRILLFVVASIFYCHCHPPLLFAQESVHLTIRTFLPSERAASGVVPAAGVSLSAQGVDLGMTDGTGQLTVKVPSGQVRIDARLRPFHAASEELFLDPVGPHELDLILDEGKEIAEDAELVLEPASMGLLDINFPTLTLRFVKAGAQVPLRHLDQLDLLDFDGNPVAALHSQFSLQPDGRLVATQPQALRNILLGYQGLISFYVHGEDAGGLSYDGEVKFRLGRFQVEGRLLPPPSNPALETAGIAVEVSLLNSDLVLHAVTDAEGRFTLPLLPSGNFDITSETLQGGKYYYGQETVVVAANLDIAIVMLSMDDLIAGVASLIESNGRPGVPVGERTPGSLPPPAWFGQTGRGQGTTAEVQVTAGGQNAPVEDTATLSVPQGTQRVLLTYRVQTDEYPTYVLAQSIYNDTWKLVVRGGTAGKQLFTLSRQINSQLQISPLWQSDGSTGQLQESLDVSALTADSDATLTLFASAMNVGDGILPTRVQASLGSETGVTIDSITADKVSPTVGDSSYYSIPRPGAMNHYARRFTLKITKPEGSQVSKITVTLLGSTVLDEGIGDNVEEIDDKTLKLRVTFHDQASEIEGEPPTASTLTYGFKLTVVEDGQELTDEKSSSTRQALWRMPDGFPRYSTRDTGGDDWCARSTYEWMVANEGLLTKINDISGEHSRNIGHQSHQHGTDIDMFHFYTFPGGTTGAANFQRLSADVVTAAQISNPNSKIRAQAEAARNRVIAWAQATRAGLAGLAGSAQVARLLYVKGSEGGGLSDGWARDLLTTGATMVGTAPVNLGLGTWSNAKYLPRNDHNDHVHITLTRTGS